MWEGDSLPHLPIHCCGSIDRRMVNKIAKKYDNVKMKKKLLILSLLLLSLTGLAQSSLEQRIDSLLGMMTTEEKIALIHAQSKFSSPGVARLGIPGLWCTDGPHGIRAEVKWDEFLPDIIKDAVWTPARRETAFSKYAQCRIYG